MHELIDGDFIDSVEVYPPDLLLRVWVATVLGIAAGSVVGVAAHSGAAGFGTGCAVGLLCSLAMFPSKRRFAPIDGASVVTLTSTKLLVDRQFSGARVTERPITEVQSCRTLYGISSARMPTVEISFRDGTRWRCGALPNSLGPAEFAASLTIAITTPR